MAPKRRSTTPKKAPRRVDDILSEALQGALDKKVADPVAHVGKYLCELSGTTSPAAAKKAAPAAAHGHCADDGDDDPASYAGRNAFGIASQRTGWLLIFLGGLLLCTSVMASFEALLHKEGELSFFVPLLIGSAGNSGGQTVSTVIRALGSGVVKLEDGPRVVAKEAMAGVMQASVLASALFPVLLFVQKISFNVR